MTTPLDHAQALGADPALGFYLGWCDGQLVDPRTPLFSLEDRGLLFGEAAYEGILFHHGRPFMAEAHLMRLGRSCEGVGLDPEVIVPVARRAVAELAEASAREPWCFLYLHVTGGAHPRDHLPPVPPPAPRVFGTVRAFPMAATRKTMQTGIGAITVPDRRWKGATYKTAQLLPNVLGKRAARSAGEAEALFVDGEGRVVEGTASNLFAVFDGKALTPPTTANILPGITRDRILTSFPGRTAVADLPLEQLRKADEIFLTSTTRPVLPIVRLDGQPVGSGDVGPNSRDLENAFHDLVLADTRADAT